MADDFNFDDDFLEGDDDFRFDEQSDEAEIDDEGFGSLDDFGEELEEDFLEEDGGGPSGGGGGTSRTFIMVAAAMFVVFLVGLVLLILLIARPQGPTPTQYTATKIVELNATTEAQLNATQTQQVIDATQNAVIAMTATRQAQLDATATAEANATATAEANIQATNMALSLTPALVVTTPAPEITVTPGAVEASPTVEVIGVSQVQQTATALFLTLQPVGTATPGGAIGGPVAQPTALTSLPNGGIFDDVTGGMSITAFFLMAFGLVGVIVFSRKARDVNNRKR